MPHATAPTSSWPPRPIEPHPKLPGTIYSAADEIDEAGGQALAVAMDVRDEAQVEAAVAQAVDAVRRDRHPRQQRLRDLADRHARDANEALRPDAPGQRPRHLPVLAEGDAASRSGPPTRTSSTSRRRSTSTLQARWFAPHVAYTMAKYGMTLCALGMAEEFRADGIAVNALWPRTAIDTEAIRLDCRSGRAKAHTLAGNHGRRGALDRDAAAAASARGDSSWMTRCCERPGWRTCHATTRQASRTRN